MKYKCTVVETYTCVVDIPEGITIDYYIRDGNELPYNWSLPDEVDESFEKVQ
jgi:hypothetical protein